MVEKKPYTVDIENVEILVAVKFVVLSVITLITEGKEVIPAAGRPVKSEPSPICFP